MAPQKRPQITKLPHFQRSAIDAGRDRRDRVHEGDHVEEQRQHAGVDAAAGQRPAALEEEDPVAVADQRAPDRCAEATEVARHVERTERQREPDQEEGDEAEAEDGEVGADHVGGVFRTAEARLDEREAGLHEDHQDGADDHPQHVDLSTECSDWVVLHRDEARRERQHSFLLCLFGWPVCHARRQLTYVAFRRNIPFVSC